jgi:hypothetical protein
VHSRAPEPPRNEVLLQGLGYRAQKKNAPAPLPGREKGAPPSWDGGRPNARPLAHRRRGMGGSGGCARGRRPCGAGGEAHAVAATRSQFCRSAPKLGWYRWHTGVHFLDLLLFTLPYLCHCLGCAAELALCITTLRRGAPNPAARGAWWRRWRSTPACAFRAVISPDCCHHHPLPQQSGLYSLGHDMAGDGNCLIVYYCARGRLRSSAQRAALLPQESCSSGFPRRPRPPR